jgi:nitrite reductase (NADH) small subunit
MPLKPWLEEAMSGQWKLVCKVKDIPPEGTRLVQRGLAWQELPGVVLFRTMEDVVTARLDLAPHQNGARAYMVKIEDGKVYLDLDEVNAPASKAELALAGAFGVATRVMAFV